MVLSPMLLPVAVLLVHLIRIKAEGVSRAQYGQYMGWSRAAMEGGEEQSSNGGE
jgi:hypothetical protein